MNVFLVHGSIGKPFENWFPWLEKKLSEQEISCTIPTFPTPEYQNYSDWEELMNYYVERGYINPTTILIGHSCGSLFIAKYLSSHEIRVGKLIFVSGYTHFISGYDFMDKLNNSFYTQDDINMCKHADSIVSFYGDDDPNVPQENLRGFAKQVGGRGVCVQGAGHFNSKAGYDECDLILSEILSEL